MTYDSKSRTIVLGGNSDKHELLVDSGLHFVHNLRFYAARPNAPKRVSANWKTLEEWLGCAGRDLNPDDVIKIGDAFYSYFAKGISPSVELENTFKYFADRANRHNRVRITVPPQVEQVFDQMFATDEEIQAKKKKELQHATFQVPIGKVTHYSNSKRLCCCSIALRNGEKVLISIATAPTPSVKIFKMGWLGIFREQTIWEYNPNMAGGYDAYLRKMMMMFRNPMDNEFKHPLDILRDLVLPCRSVAEVRDLLFDAERNVSK